MGFTKLLLLIFAITSGTIITLIVIFSGEDDNVLGSNSTHTKPGSIDATRNKFILFFAIIFVVSILAINTIFVRSENKKLSLEKASALSKEDEY